MNNKRSVHIFDFGNISWVHFPLPSHNDHKYFVPLLPSSGSFLADASRSATLAAKDTCLLDSDCWRLLALRPFLSAFRFLVCISFSYTAHLFSCWVRLFWAALSLSRLGTLSSCCSSWISSRWLAMMGRRGGMESSSVWWRGGGAWEEFVILTRVAPLAVASSHYRHHHPFSSSKQPERGDGERSWATVHKKIGLLTAITFINTVIKCSLFKVRLFLRNRWHLSFVLMHHKCSVAFWWPS